MIIYVDIDGTICSQEENYIDAKPFMDKIKKVNAMYDQGHTIVYYTARGSSSGKNWSALTYDQLVKWGCQFHSIVLSKPSYDVIYDDKARIL
jgi:uncharacterized HAD superfamily protein